MPTISYANYPASNRVPGAYAEIDPSKANTGVAQQRTLIVAQMLAAGTATAGVPVLGSSYAAARTAFGAGSMLSLMYAQYRKSDTFGEVWLLPLADNGAGTAATNTLTVTGTATAAGTLSLYVCGVLVPVAVASGAANTAVATAINAAINGAVDLPVTASVATNIVTVAARHKGVTAGDIDLRLNYAGASAGEATPAGVSVAVGAGTAGTGEPTVSFAGLGDVAYDYIVTPYSGATELAPVTALLNDTTGRWSWQQELFGHAFSAREGTAAGLATYGTGLNDQHVTVFGMNDLPDPIYAVAAEYGAACANSLRVDPALPLQNIVLNIKAPARTNRFLLSERNTLYYSGVSTGRVNDAGQVILERAVTTYRTNAAGAADDSYLDVETMATLQALLRDLRDRLNTRFARKKLVADGTNIPGGSTMVTSKSVLGDVVGWYRQKGVDGLVQDIEGFARNARAENAGNGRVSLLLPLNVANQLRVISMLVQFVKS